MKVKTIVSFADGHIKVPAGVELEIERVSYGAESSLVAWCISEKVNGASLFPVPVYFISLFCETMEEEKKEEKVVRSDKKVDEAGSYILPRKIMKVKENEHLMIASTPIGYYIDFTGEEIPEGWMECDGRFLFAKDYQELAKVIAGNYTERFYREVERGWWIFQFKAWEEIDMLEEYGLIQMPKIWHARFSTSEEPRSKWDYRS